MGRRIKIDLHTHSVASPDGGLSERDYRKMLDSGQLDYVAVTDHNTTDFARQLQAKLGDRIIVGEEIRTTQGEIIGLYLKETVPKLLGPLETIAAIRRQGGLVCIPHPFESVRSGITELALETIAGDVDMIEVHNGRAVFQNKSKQAYAWMVLHGCRGVANSDSHAPAGWGRTYTVLEAGDKGLSRETLTDLLQEAEYVTSFPGVRAVLYPKLNRLNKIGLTKLGLEKIRKGRRRA